MGVTLRLTWLKQSRRSISQKRILWYGNVSFPCRTSRHSNPQIFKRQFLSSMVILYRRSELGLEFFYVKSIVGWRNNAAIYEMASNYGIIFHLISLILLNFQHCLMMKSSICRALSIMFDIWILNDDPFNVIWINDSTFSL